MAATQGLSSESKRKDANTTEQKEENCNKREEPKPEDEIEGKWSNIKEASVMQGRGSAAERQVKMEKVSWCWANEMESDRWGEKSLAGHHLPSFPLPSLASFPPSSLSLFVPSFLPPYPPLVVLAPRPGKWKVQIQWKEAIISKTRDLGASRELFISVGRREGKGLR